MSVRRVQVFVVDAFTDTAFAGNPAGVVVLTDHAEPDWMQSVAAELRHSETAFVRARADGDYDLCWFTPTVEVDLCGHATLATAHVLAAEGRTGTLRFHTRSGVLTATVSAAGVILDFPAQPVASVNAPAGLVEALDVEPLGVYSNGMDLLIELSDAAAVAAVRPDMARLREIECRGVIVTAATTPDAEHDFVSRFFAPRAGVDEDPVTGSAHCALGPFWAARSARTALIGVQLSDRGGRVAVEVRGDRVTLAGAAITVLDGQLRV